MVNSALATGDFFHLKPGDSALLCLSADYIAAKMMLVRAMVLGLSLDYVAPSANPLTALDKQYDFCAMVPLQVRASLGDVHNIKKLIIGGGAVPHGLKTKLANLSTSCYETYGMTETITHIAVKSLNSGDDTSYFKTLPNISISKDDRDCLVIEAPQITSERVTTNDLVTIVDDTRFEWLGRYDNVINSGGLKLIPEQIEQKLSSVVASSFFVAGIPDDHLGEKLILIVEGEVNLDIVHDRITNLEALGRYEKPKQLYRLPKFVRTQSDKVQRKATLQLLFG